MENGAKHTDASNPIIALKSRDELEVMKLLAKEISYSKPIQRRP
jgi:hypothetical protein